MLSSLLKIMQLRPTLNSLIANIGNRKKIFLSRTLSLLHQIFKE